MQLGSEIEHQINELSTSQQPEIEITSKHKRDTIIHVQETEIRFKCNDKKKESMTTEILYLMEERGKCKNSLSQYKELDKNICRKCRNAREEWISEKCREIEMLQKITHATLYVIFLKK